MHHVRGNNWCCFSGVLSSNSYRLTLLGLSSHTSPEEGRPAQIIVHTPSHINITKSTPLQTARNSLLSLIELFIVDDAQRLRSSVHRRNSHGAVTQPWQIPTLHRIHVLYPNVYDFWMNYYVFIHTSLYNIFIVQASLKVLMTRDLFCSTPCDSIASAKT